MYRKIVVIFIFSYFLINCTFSFAQNIIEDTTIISFHNFPKKNTKAIIDSIIDQRNENPYIIGKEEKTKYLFIPIDLLICTKKPLNKTINEMIESANQSNTTPHLNLLIDEFQIHKKSNSLLYPHYVLNASIQVYHQTTENRPDYIGDLLYETTTRQKIFGDQLEKGFKKVIGKWQKHLVNDLNAVVNAVQTETPVTFENFRRDRYRGKRINLIANTEVFIGTHDWILDGEIYFSHREANSGFYRSGYGIRYRNADTFESIAFSQSCDNWFYRFHPNGLFLLKSQLFFGVNRWRDFATVKHKIWDAFIIDYSLSQSLLFNPLDKRSLLFGIGLMEDVFYIYSKRLKFQFGLLLNLGIKL